jgi:nitroreductase
VDVRDLTPTPREGRRPADNLAFVTSDLSTDKQAETSVPVHQLIATRWSPRALDPAGEVSEPQLRALLEAARWAASYGNTQPARFLVGRRGDETFRRIHGLLAEGNQYWAEAAGALLIGLAVTENDKGELPYAEYGLGLAAQNLAVQAVAEGLVVHQMAGFDIERTSAEFGLPASVRPVIAIAVGVLGAPELLVEQRRIDRERLPRTRIPLAEVALAEWDTPAF